MESLQTHLKQNPRSQVFIPCISPAIFSLLFYFTENNSNCKSWLFTLLLRFLSSTTPPHEKRKVYFRVDNDDADDELFL